MKPIQFSPEAYKKLEELKHKNPKLLNKVQKQLKLFKQDSRHKSLRLHKITNQVENTWSISIDKSFRILYTELEDSIYFFKIGSHDEV